MSNSSKPIILAGIFFLVAVSFELFCSRSSLTYLTDTKFDGSEIKNSSTSSNNTGLKKSNIVLVIGGIAVVALITCLVVRKGTTTSSIELNLDKKKELEDNKFKAFVPNKTKQEFLNDRVNDLIELQNSRMNLDYNTLKTKVSEELFIEYSNELNNLNNNNERNIMKDFKLIDSMVSSADVKNGKYEIKVEIIMQYIDYIVKDNLCVKGDEYLPITKHYELTFTSPIRSSLENCPTCGSVLEDKNSKICSHCNSPIIKDSKWILSKKICKGQK